jgi:hypothetical protein
MVYVNASTELFQDRKTTDRFNTKSTVYQEAKEEQPSNQLEVGKRAAECI